MKEHRKEHGKGMANPNGNPQNLAPRWEKGTSGNKNGRPRIRDDLKAVKLLTKTEMRRLIQKIIDMPPEELAEMSKRKDVPALEIMLASVAYKAITHGDQARINFLLERTIGKVAEKHEHELVNVTYKTEVREDGTLLQQIHTEENETIDVGKSSESKTP